ncbi:MAG: winged helix-turn-helix domain-containing protein [Gammaproteobacteria bacterium]
MRWLVGEFEFDAGSKVLRSTEGDIILEPKAAALLSFFCENSDRDITREELLEAVWYGQVVSDNSVNRVIVLLRKALRDEDKVRRYIATIPKLGYRFIAKADRLEHSAIGAIQNKKASSTWTVIAGLTLVFTAAVLVYLKPFETPPGNDRPSFSVTPLSRLPVPQSNADLSLDGSRLLYSANNGSGTAVYMTSQTLPQPVQISPPGGYADLAKWANNDEFAVYLYMREQRCEFHKVKIENTTLQPPAVIYQCLPDSYSEFSFSPDNSKLYFSERANSFAPYAIYELDLNKGSKRRLSQPVARGLGNHFVDVHPNTGALLLLSDHAPGKTSVYELDTRTDSFSRRKVFDYSLQSAVWSHQGDSIVHPSLHPSYQLLKTNLGSGDSQVIVSDSRRITGPRRIPSQNSESTDYLFTSYLYNRDISSSRYPESQLNSAVMDYLPSLSNSGDKLAFVSKRNGYSQVWIKNFNDESLIAIEPRDKGRLFTVLAWSPDDQQILANTNSGLIVYAVESNTQLHNLEFALPVYAASWHDNQTLAYSHFEDDHWHAYRVNLETGDTTSVNERWAFSMRNATQQIYLDQNFTAFRDDIELTPLKSCAGIVWRYRLRLILDGDNIYCHANDAYNDLLRFDREMKAERLSDAVERYEYFSVVDDHFVFTSAPDASSDIMQTNSSAQ